MKNSSKTKLVVLLLTMGLLASCNPSTPTSDSGKTTDPSVNPSETTSEDTSTTSETTSEGTSDTSVETTSEEITSEETTSEETTSEEATSEETASEETTSEETTSEDTSSETTSETTSEEEGVTLAEVVSGLLENAAAKRAKLVIEGFVTWEYLGPTIALADYEDYADDLFFETEQGTFYYVENDQGEFELEEFDDVEGHGVYEYMIYSPYDFIDATFADLLTETSETDDTFVVSFDLTNEDATFYKQVFAALAGIGSYYSYVTNVELILNKDATAFDINVTAATQLFSASVTEFGTHTNEEIENFVKNLPPYEPPVIPEAPEEFTNAIETLVEASESHQALVEVPNWADTEYLGDFKMYILNYYYEYEEVRFNNEGTGYTYRDYGEGDGFELTGTPQDGGYSYASTYSVFDILNDELLEGAIYMEEDENAYYGFLDLDAFSYAASSFGVITGWGYDTPATEVEFEFAKDGSEITFNAKVGSSSETVIISEVGTLVDTGVDAIIDGIINAPVEPEEELTEWPAAVVTKLGESIANALPIFPGAISASAYDYQGALEIGITVAEGTNVDEAVEAYCGILAETFTGIENTHGFGGDTSYLSADESFEVVPYIENDFIYIHIFKIGDAGDLLSEFPVEYVKTCTGYEGELPSIEGAAGFLASDEDGYVTINAYYETEEGATESIANFEKALEDAGFTPDTIYGLMPGYVTDDGFIVVNYGIAEESDIEGLYLVYFDFFYGF